MSENFINDKKIDYFDLWEKKDFKRKINYKSEQSKKDTIKQKTFSPKIETAQMKVRREEIETTKMIIDNLSKNIFLDEVNEKYELHHERRDQIIYLKKILKKETQVQSIFYR